MMKYAAIATASLVVALLTSSVQASDKGVIVENTPLPVSVVNPVTSVSVTGSVDASGSDVNATIVGTPEVTLANQYLTTSYKPDLAAMRPVAMLQRVNSDNEPEDRSGDTTETLWLCISGVCSNAAELSSQIQDGSNEILVVTSVEAVNWQSATAPDPAEYSAITLGKCRTGVFSYTVGLGPVTVDGRNTTQVTFNPGLVISDLSEDQRVCFTSYAQSTIDTEVTLHGYLTTRP